MEIESSSRVSSKNNCREGEENQITKEKKGENQTTKQKKEENQTTKQKNEENQTTKQKKEDDNKENREDDKNRENTQSEEDEDFENDCGGIQLSGASLKDTQTLFDRVKKSVRPKKEELSEVIKKIQAQEMEMQSKNFTVIEGILREQNELRKRTLERQDAMLNVMKAIFLKDEKGTKKRKHVVDDDSD